jgi:heptosyltransferase-3
LRRLLIRPGAIGDLVVSLPALEHLRADYTEVWVARPNVPLVRFADRVRAIPDTGLDLLEIEGQEASRVVEALRGFESIISWYGSQRPEFVERVRELGLPFTFFPALPDGSVHAVDYYLAQVGGSAGRRPAIRCEMGERRNCAIIHPFSGSARKNWPLERFRALAARLEELLPVLWTAGPSERLEEAIRFDNLYELACWLGSARLFIGNDSGISHLAAAAGTPVVAIFGPTDPAVWAPRGARVEVVRHEPLSELDVDAVWQAVEKLC